MEKKAFLLYQDYRAHLDLIECDAEFRALIEAVFDCAAGKEVKIQNLTPVSKMAYSFISTNVKRDKEKYEKTVKARARAGAIGGAVKQANATFAKQKKTRQANLADIDTDIGIVKDTVKDIDINKNTISDDEFDQIWKSIPPRDGTNNKREAKRYINARLKEGHEFLELFNGLIAYRNYCERAGLFNTEIVMTMSRFFGRDKYFTTDNEWETKGYGNKTKKKFGTAELNDHLRTKARKIIES